MVGMPERNVPIWLWGDDITVNIRHAGKPKYFAQDHISE